MVAIGGRPLPAIPAGVEADLHDLCDDAAGCMSRLHRLHGPLVQFPKGGETTVFAFSSEASESLFSDPDSFHVHGQPGPKGSSMRRFGRGLFGVNGQTAQQFRKLILPAVARSTVEGAEEAMLALVEEQIGEWKAGLTIDLAAAMKKLALRITGRMLFGLEDFAIADLVAATFQEWLDDYIRVLFASAFPVEIDSSCYKRWLATGDRLEAQLRALIDQRQATLREGQNDLLALLLKARMAGRLADDDLMGEMHTLFNASYQTTASGLLWMLLMLAQHPEAQRGVLHEHERPALAAPPGVAGWTERAIRESLRLFPPVTFILRRAVRPARVAGHEVPTGTVIFLGIYALHRDTGAYPEPRRFLPDRWLDRKPSPYGYVPFGAGPRMCMGTAFSRQLFLQVAQAVTSRFRLSMAPLTRIDRRTSLTLGTAGPVPVTLLPRESESELPLLTGNIHEMVALPRFHPQWTTEAA